MSKFSELVSGGKPSGQAERDAATNAARNAYGQQVAAISPYQQYGAGQLARYGNQSNNALDAYTSFLNRGVTDQQKAAYSNQLMGNYQDAFNRGQSNLLAQSRGFGMGSPLDSSLTAGLLGNLYAQQAGVMGGAGAQTDQWARAMQEQNLANRYGALNSAAQGGVGIGLQTAGMLGNAGNAYTGALSNLAQQATQAQEESRNRFMNGISSLASAAGSIYGAAKGAPMAGGGGGHRSPAPYSGGDMSANPGTHTPQSSPYNASQPAGWTPAQSYYAQPIGVNSLPFSSPGMGQFSPYNANRGISNYGGLRRGL